MATFSHIGGNVCAIAGMPWSYYRDPNLKEQYNYEERRFIELLSSIKFKYLLAITANKYQKIAADILKENKFKEIVTFYSSHGHADETLTLWVKTQKKASDFSKDPIRLPGWNCSVTYNREANRYRFIIMAQKPEESDEDFKKRKFRRVKNTPIWFKVAEKQTVKEVKKPKTKEEKAVL